MPTLALVQCYEDALASRCALKGFIIIIIIIVIIVVVIVIRSRPSDPVQAPYACQHQ